MESIVELSLADIPAVGASLADGIFAGLTTAKDGKHFAVVLLESKPGGPLSWKAAMAWAEGVGGALPTRPVAALLFANAKDAFQRSWYWSCEEYESNGSYAWYQTFSYGNQNYLGKSYEGRARAVRRLTV